MAEFPKRKRNRLPYWDYSSHGAYFITICTDGHKNTLCRIVGDGFPVPKPAGKIAEHFIQQIPVKYPSVNVEKYVIMPNHIHLLLFMSIANGTGGPSPTMGNVIGWFKYQVTKAVNESLGTVGKRFFQRSYHDHVIRNERDYLRIWEYIDNNPRHWKEDCFFQEVL